MDQAKRFPWNHFPGVFIHASERFLKTHHAYNAAKAGNNVAAMELAADAISIKVLDQLWKRFDAYAPVLVSPHSSGLSGVDAIPEAMAWVVSDLLKWPYEERVVQRNNVSHTGASGYERLQRQVIFQGPVVVGLNYLLVDDFVTHGGTLANLRGHILAQKGYVIGATVLAGKDYSAELALPSTQLAELRSKHGHIEYWWRQRFGFGFECLTASEARYLSRARTTESIIEALEAVDQ
jgi:adenine/guanine phosphoribosyltransferase-like PRPP-binding protein